MATPLPKISAEAAIAAARRRFGVEKTKAEAQAYARQVVTDAVLAALGGNTSAFDSLPPELDRLARSHYETCVRAGEEPPNVSSSHSPRPAL